MDLTHFIESFPQLQEFLYVGIFDHDFHRTFVTWSNHKPIHQTPNFPENIENAKNSHISHIVLLPYNSLKKPIFVPTDGHIVLDHQNKNILIVGSEEFHNSYRPHDRYKNSALSDINIYTSIPIPEETKIHYIDGVTKILNEIKEGNIYQCNVAWRSPVFTIKNDLEIYIRLQRKNPSRFGCWIKCQNTSYISNSPEQFLHIYHHPENSCVSSTPIKGTRQNRENWKNKEELWDCKKERAELTMVVDMVRNDFGKFCTPGSIIAGNRNIRRCGDLYHAEQQVRGIFSKEEVSLSEVLQATFPAASVTGTPKRAAMNYISQIELTPRNMYTGSMGWLKSNGEMHVNVAIRMIEVEDNIGFFHVGCGIVSDSNPQREWEESIAKSNAIMRTLGKNWI